MAAFVLASIVAVTAVGPALAWRDGRPRQVVNYMVEEHGEGEGEVVEKVEVVESRKCVQ